MPPKKEAAAAKAKGSGKGGKGKKQAPEPPLVDGKPPPDGRQLWLATDALQKAKAMRNYFQLERDRIISFWEISKKQLGELKASCRQRERDKAEAEERHEVEKKVFKQKIRHLLYEHQLQLAEMTSEAERTLAIREEEYRQKERNAAREIHDGKLLLREQENEHREMTSALIAAHDKAIAEQQLSFERKMKEIHLMFEKKTRDLREEMDQQCREEVGLVEKRKADHIAELREMHERTFKEMKDYYSEITSNNMEMIRTLKDEVYARKRTEAHNERAMMDVAQRNRKLTEPLAKLQRQKRELEQELVNYASDKEKLKAMKAEVQQCEQELRSLSWEHEVLFQRFGKLEEDRDIILKKYNDMLQEIQQKATFRRVLIQSKLELVQTQLEGRDARLTELLRRANIDPDGISEIERRVRDLSIEKDAIIGNLQHLIGHLADKQQALVSAYEKYLKGYGITGSSSTL
ncbi:trypanin-related protein, putative [Trypanosoma brucei gambiense DAL972]|uniref:Trypanin-related protein, putative n=1 Tax=Trypanosoma brucei gambiense (strain MHOM/CI/86/DAL972) TaxID=679716 RepID=C9ZZK6_TRYB9|nr:trypanin-related protein, putative [Trypanosoma brucei gambiense DAL972]CBH14855.1 trypanin-related protein, putative [Trypanosoma brucei gambiense DAL972]|eukprot:XP_011777121.1 trypanin-related protein, putative [Trypanosoma brucei gambiense DAL972]